jgi:putative Mg2+ transporter-C (MgtC) family protein
MLMIGPAVEAWNASLNHWFSSLGAPVEDVVRLLLAAIFGGMVGIEREVRGRQAGFRTCLLVCVGSALVMLVSIEFARQPWSHQNGVNINVDPARIAYGVMTGIGFLCAGVIIKGDSGVRGLTTAAGMWCVAAIGLSIGFGMYLLSTLATVIVVSALWVLDYLGDMLPKTKHRKIVIRSKYRPECIAQTIAFVRSAGVKVQGTSIQRSEDLASADVDVRIAFTDDRAYYKLERALESSPEYNLIASHEG